MAEEQGRDFVVIYEAPYLDRRTPRYRIIGQHVSLRPVVMAGSEGEPSLFGTAEASVGS